MLEITSDMVDASKRRMVEAYIESLATIEVHKDTLLTYWNNKLMQTLGGHVLRADHLECSLFIKPCYLGYEKVKLLRLTVSGDINTGYRVVLWYSEMLKSGKWRTREKRCNLDPVFDTIRLIED